MQDDLKRLARMRAKKRLNSWSEQFKSPWIALMMLVIFGSLLALPITWMGWVDDDFILLVPVFTTLVVGLAIWIINRLQKSWERKRLREFYEEELLELKVKKGSSVPDEYNAK